jgi:hypothetical protein
MMAEKRASILYSFDAPAEADWHRMISEAAYYRALRREFSAQSALEHWIAAEREIKDLLTRESDAQPSAAGGAMHQFVRCRTDDGHSTA